MKRIFTALCLMLLLLVPTATVSAKSAAPSKVTVKSLKASGTDKITLTWNKAKNATSYQISYKTGSGKWTPLASVKANQTSYTHKSNFAGGKKYTYQVKAYNSKSKKYGSAKAKSITLPVIPGSVKLVSARYSGKNVVITWKKTSNATEYRIFYRASKSAKWKKLAAVSSSKSNYTYKNGKNGFYTVQAYNKKSKKSGAYNTNGLAVSNKTTPSKPAKPNPTPTPSKPTPAPSAIKVTSLTVPDENANLTFAKKNQTYHIKVTVSPANATNKALLWASSNPGVAKVDQKGNVTALSNGITYINIRTSDGSLIEKDVKVTVKIAPDIVKVQSITLSPSSLSLTSKGQTVVLTATVMPANATNKNITWTSGNTNVVTVDNNGTVTAVNNGQTYIYAQSNDGTYISAICQVTVEIPTQPETISLAGGKGSTIGPDFMEFSSINFSKVTFEFSNGFENNFEINGYNSTEYAAGVTITALRKGSATVVAKYEGKVIKKYNVVATSDWAEYLGYVSWRKSVESQIWKSNMTLTEKLDAAQNYIKTNFTYKLGADGPVYAYNQTPKTADCTTASSFMGDFAKDLGCTVGYVNMTTDQVYDSMADAMGAAGGHIFTVVKLDGQWVSYDAQPPHN